MVLYILTGLRQLIHLFPPYKWDPADFVETYEMLMEP